jgi:hypothetical protein
MLAAVLYLRLIVWQSFLADRLWPIAFGESL